MAIKTPLAQVKEKFGSKEKLVEAIVKGLPNFEGAELDKRSNKRLLRLERAVRTISEAGGVQRAAQTIADLRGLGKDGDYVKSVASYPIPKLAGELNAAQRKASKKKK